VIEVGPGVGGGGRAGVADRVVAEAEIEEEVDEEGRLARAVARKGFARSAIS
jgi:hypothetical protein